MKKTLLLIFTLLLCAATLSAGDYIIGTGTSTTKYVPVYGYSNYGWSKFIYTASDVIGAGYDGSQPIESISFFVDTETSDYVMDNQQVYMGYNYVDAVNTSYLNTDYYSLVYNGSVSWEGPGWVEITLDTPFAYNPSNGWALEIIWENRAGSRLAGPPYFRTTSTDYYSCAYKNSNTSFPASSGSRKRWRPNIWIATAATAAPPAAEAIAPVDNATDVEINTRLRWQHTGGSPTEYRLWFGTDNPPTNLVNNLLTTENSYTPAELLDYDTTYFWKVVPINSFGPTMDASIWSFSTAPDPSIAEFPYLEDFDGTFPPTGWTHYRGDLQSDPIEFGSENSSQWDQENWLNIASDDKAAAINVWANISGFMISPLFNIPSDDYVLEFDAAVLRSGQTPDGTPPNYTNTDDQFAILIGDGFNWSLADVVREYNNSGSEFVLHDIPTTGEKISIPLTGHTGHKRIAIFAGSLTMDDDNDVMFNNFRIGLPEAEADIPEGETTPIGDTGDSVTITGGDANINTEAVIPDWPNGSMAVIGNYYLELTGAGPWTVVFTTTAPWGAYYVDGAWTPAENVGGTITFNIPIPSGKDLGVPIVLGDADPTLPVELSVFNAVLTVQNFVKLTWISESETNMLGYRVYRNETSVFDDNTLLITPVMIQATNTSSTQSYVWEDREVSLNSSYYYWLEAVDYGHSSFFGPQFVEVIGEDSPELPTQTTMGSAYPNPFKANSNTNIEVSVKEGDSGTVTIYNVVGQTVKTFPVKEGINNLQWNGKDSKGSVCGSGIYFYKLSTSSKNQTKKMVIMR